MSELKDRYGDAHNFLKLFNPDHQVRYCRDIDRCFVGKAPSIGLISQTYGSEIAELWIEIQLKNLSDYTGCKTKLRPEQTENIAWIIISEYFYLKISELMYFFLLWKSGRFGRFYGSVDPIQITESLIEFRKVRFAELDRIEKREIEDRKKQEYEDRQAMERRGELVGPEYIEEIKKEFEELNWLFNMGYEKPIKTK